MLLRSRTMRARWSTGELLTCIAWLLSTAVAAWYAMEHGLNPNRLFMSLFVGTFLVLGAYDTLHDQPTQYNLLRAWPFGTAADDELRGQQTVSSQALHLLMGLSMCLCLLQIAIEHS
jgi:hypothetical protein